MKNPSFLWRLPLVSVDVLNSVDFLLHAYRFLLFPNHISQVVRLLLLDPSLHQILVLRTAFANLGPSSLNNMRVLDQDALVVHELSPAPDFGEDVQPTPVRIIITLLCLVLDYFLFLHHFGAKVIGLGQIFPKEVWIFGHSNSLQELGIFIIHFTVLIIKSPVYNLHA